MWYRTEFDLNVLFMDLSARKMSFNALVFTLRSKVDLIWTRAIRPVKAQSVKFSKIAKKLNIDLWQFFLIERKHRSYWNHETQNRGHRTRFCGRAATSAHQMHFLRFLRVDWGEFHNMHIPSTYIESHLGKKQPAAILLRSVRDAQCKTSESP